MKLEKLRLSVPMSSDLYSKVEYHANQLGVSKSSYVSFVVAQYITSQELVFKQLEKSFNLLPQDIVDQIKLLKSQNENL